MSKQISEINDRTRVRYSTKQAFVKDADPAKRLTNNDELSLDSRSHGTLASVLIQRDTAHYVFNRVTGIKDILQICRYITCHKPASLFDQSLQQ